MRKIVRTQTPIPEVLHDEVARAAKNELAKYYQLPVVERARRRPPLNTKIWASESIQDSLLKVFHSKCAYCESPLGKNQSGDIAHHRPIGNAANLRNQESGATSSDHYSWFTYEWENLFLSCAECNRSKRNLFPVAGPRAQLRCTWAEAEKSERALLINPCGTEPKKHLRFWIDGTAHGIDEIGGVTVEVLSLNRPALIEDRARKLQRCLNALEDGRNNFQAFTIFQQELQDDAPFSGAARIAFFDLLSNVASRIGLAKPLFRNLAEDAIRIAMSADRDQWETQFRLSNLGPRASERIYEYAFAETLRESRHIEKPRTSQLLHISIRNFKGVARLDLQIPPAQSSAAGAPCMMLLGENSTGKSSTLQAIALALMGQKMRNRMGVSVEDFLPREATGWQLDDTATPEITLSFDTGDPVRLHIDPLTKQFNGDYQRTTVLFAFGSRRFFGKNIARRQHTSALKSLFDPFAKLQHPGRWLQELGSEAFDALARAMREVLVLQEEDSIGRDEDGRLFVRAHGRDTPLERLSDGYRSLLAMVLDVMRGMIEEWGDLENARGLVLIDEIETHLHPRWKLRVMSALRRAMPNVQFIATTHDPLCLRGMRNGEVHPLIRDDNQMIQVLTGLPDVRGLRAEQLLTSDYFGLSSTADPDIENSLEQLALPTKNREAQTLIDVIALRSFKWIGDTPIEQVINEALKRFIDDAEKSPEIDRSQIREAAVNSILGHLRSLRESL